MAISKWVSVLVILLLLFGTGLPMYKLYSSNKAEEGMNGNNMELTGDAVKGEKSELSLALPAFAKQNAKTAKAYEIAVARKDEFKFLTCHCGCGMHAMSHRGKTIPKMNHLADCFVRADGTWEDHAAVDCPYCVDLAIMADDMLNRGYTLRQVRDIIDTKYNQIPPPNRAMDMNPPMPPA